jgi:hypothetical protein
MNSSLKISPEEYQRRSEFNETLKTMSRSEYIEIARILRKFQIPISENRGGLYFNLVELPANVFEELLKFQEFVRKNTQELEKRTDLIHQMESEIQQSETDTTQ